MPARKEFLRNLDIFNTFTMHDFIDAWPLEFQELRPTCVST